MICARSAALTLLAFALAACGGGTGASEDEATNTHPGGHPSGGQGTSGAAGGPSAGKAGTGGATAGGVSAGQGGGFVPEGGAGGGAGEAACAKSQAAAKKVPIDVIVSVDQSGSMSDDIANVKANINKLSDFLNMTKLDHRVIMVGTVGTGKYQICVPPPLGGANCAAKPPLFNTVNQNVQSKNTLSLLLSTYDLTSGDKAWKPVLRKDALKVFVPITDDNSTLTGVEFDKQLLAKPGGQFGDAKKRNYVVFPIMGAPDFPKETPKCGSNAVNTGSEYISLVKLTKGKWFPICLTNFGPVFEEIAKTAASKVACELGIPEPPKGETLDPTKVNVTYTPGGTGKDEAILQDTSKPCDAGANGWQYNADKSKILLCGTACAKVQADPAAKVNVEFGCETQIVVPQ